VGRFALGGTYYSAHRMWNDVPEGYSSGQRGQTVNLLAMPSEVRILPPPPLSKEWYKNRLIELERHLAIQGGCSSRVEPQPSKLMMWVRFPSPAPYKWLGTWVKKAHIAQVVEHSLGKGEVTGSSPVVGTIW
jgi:hypothetical protein